MAHSLDGTTSSVLLYRYRDYQGSVEFRTYRPELDIPGAVLYHFRLISQSPPRWEFVPVARAAAAPARRDRRRRVRPACFVRVGPPEAATWVPAPWPFPAGGRVHVLKVEVDEQGDVVESYDLYIPETCELASTGC